MGSRSVVTNRPYHIYNRKFLVGPPGMAAQPIPIPQLQWINDEPIWVDQWALTDDKIAALKEIVKEQLSLGHIEESFSAWNSPVFAIKKRSEKWRMLTDLRKVNASMLTMGSLQPGLPSPNMIPKDYKIWVIDIKDCFYSIPIHPLDRQRFAFSIPSINSQEPYMRYQRKVLPQGMKNSPTLCQWYVHKVLQPMREKYKEAIIIHYMDDILAAHRDGELLENMLQEGIQTLSKHGLQVAPEKIQKALPIDYLGYKLSDREIQVKFPNFDIQKVKTLNDFQKLIGEIQWCRPRLGICTSALAPLYELLKGSPDLNSSRDWTPEAFTCIKNIQNTLIQQTTQRCDKGEKINLTILFTPNLPTGVLRQQLGILEWIHLPQVKNRTCSPYTNLVAKVIWKGIQRARALSGMDPASIFTSYTSQQLEKCFMEDADWQIIIGQDYHYGNPVPFADQLTAWPWSWSDKHSESPVVGINVFTDATKHQ